MAETDCDQCAHGKLLSSRGVACCWFPGDPKEGGCIHFVDGVNASYQADLARQRLEELRQQQREDKAALAALEALQEQHNALIRVVDTMAGVIWWSQTAEMAPKHSAEQLREAWMHLREVAAKHNERWENQVMGHPGPEEGEPVTFQPFRKVDPTVAGVMRAEDRNWAKTVEDAVRASKEKSDDQ